MQYISPNRPRSRSNAPTRTVPSDDALKTLPPFKLCTTGMLVSDFAWINGRWEATFAPLRATIHMVIHVNDAFDRQNLQNGAILEVTGCAQTQKKIMYVAVTSLKTLVQPS